MLKQNLESGAVLIVATDKQTLGQLRHFVRETEGADENLLKKFLKAYQQWKTGLSKATANLAPSKAEIILVLGPSSQPLILLQGGLANQSTNSSSWTSGPRGKRRRTRGGASHVSSSLRQGNSSNLPQQMEKEAQILKDWYILAPFNVSCLIYQRIGQDESPGHETKDKDEEDDDFDPAQFDSQFHLMPCSDLIFFHTYEGERDHLMLDDVNPTYVIMVDPNPAFIRQLEVQVALHVTLTLIPNAKHLGL
jgi:DNA excision repair protein ERCC-4